MSQINGKGTVVQLSDGPHVIKFTVNVLSDIEELYGSLDLFQAALETKPFSTCRQLIKLVVECDSLEAAGNLMTDVDLQQMVTAVGEALLNAVAPDEESKAKLIALAPPMPPPNTAAAEATTAGIPSQA